MTEIPQYLCLSCCLCCHPLYSSLWRASCHSKNTQKGRHCCTFTNTEKHHQQDQSLSNNQFGSFSVAKPTKKMGKRKWGLGKGRTKKVFWKRIIRKLIISFSVGYFLVLSFPDLIKSAWFLASFLHQIDDGAKKYHKKLANFFRCSAATESKSKPKTGVALLQKGRCF